MGAPMGKGTEEETFIGWLRGFGRSNAKGSINRDKAIRKRESNVENLVSRKRIVKQAKR